MHYYRRMADRRSKAGAINLALTLLVTSFLFESYLLQCLLNWFVLDTYAQIDYLKAMGINLLILFIRKMPFKKTDSDENQNDYYPINAVYTNIAFTIILFIAAVFLNKLLPY